MKRLNILFLLGLLLAACQAQPTPTPTTPANTPTVAITKPASLGQNASTPTAIVTPTPTGPVVHASGSNPNAANFIVVKDQFLVNNSVTFDEVASAQAGWIVLYFSEKSDPGKIRFGSRIVYDRIPAGRSGNLVVPFTQNLNPSVDPSNLPGAQIDVVIQTDPMNPKTMIHDNGKLVWVRFAILSQNTTCQLCARVTATP